MTRTAISVLALSVVLPASAFAESFLSQNFIKGGKETFIVRLGGITNQFKTVISLDGPQGRGDDINLEDYGVTPDVSSFEASGMWRFGNNRINVDYFGIIRSGSHAVDRQISIDGQVIDVGFSLATESQNQFLFATYRRSFVKNSKFEFAGLFGVYGERIEFDVTATGTEQGRTVTKSGDASVILPLPLIGMTIDWYTSRRWGFSANVEGLKANIDNVDGWILVAGGDATFRLVRHFGIGASYRYTRVDVDLTKDNFEGGLTWSASSVNAYGQFEF